MVLVPRDEMKDGILAYVADALRDGEPRWI